MPGVARLIISSIRSPYMFENEMLIISSVLPNEHIQWKSKVYIDSFKVF